MTRDEKIKFIRGLSAKVIDSVVAQVDQMPDDWDGTELRTFLAESFERETVMTRRGHARRFREYRKATYRIESPTHDA